MHIPSPLRSSSPSRCVEISRWLAFALCLSLGGSFHARAQESAFTPDSAPLFTEESDNRPSRFDFDYLGVFYGPALGDWSSYQATPDGLVDEARPVQLRSWASLGTELGRGFRLAGSFSWNWLPSQSEAWELRDPNVRLSQTWNWGDTLVYFDVRLHPGFSPASRENDQLFGLQLFSSMSTPIEDSSINLGFISSVRRNIYGAQGFGNLWEFYVAPQLQWQWSSTLSFQVLFELSAFSALQDLPGVFKGDGPDLEPGLSWDISRSLNLNPFFTLYLKNGIALETTAIGLSVSWTPEGF